MRTLLRLALLLALAGVAGFAAAPARADNPPIAVQACADGTLPGGALSRICVPASWNGSLVIYAHGYVAPGEPLTVDDPISVQLSAFVQQQGYAFATTSYRRSGLAILEGVADIRELAAAFPSAAGRPASRTYVLGFSEGGLIATLLAEQSRAFSGALAACGPAGSFKDQIEYFGDFRALFDYFFPGVIPPDAIGIPPDVIQNWDSTYAPAVNSAISAKPAAAADLIRTSQAVTETATTASIAQTAQHLLWYNIFATNDAKTRLGGNPYGNAGRIYAGSSNDTKLNSQIDRYAADAAALAKLNAYQTQGRPLIPLVLMHTTGDDVVPFRQATQYVARAKAVAGRDVPLIQIDRYGHCNFQPAEVLAGFNLLIQQATAIRPQAYLALVRR